MNFISDMITNGTATSSARVINVMGAITGTLLLTYTTIISGLPTEPFAVYLAYCGGVYGAGKYLDKKDTNA